ncbi:MAG: YbaN family protein [Burkholderiaceae bacterium]|nr:YbaN family protein [Burkholderiaceae bacterium]
MTRTALILLWRAVGLLFFVIGLIGILVPVMPTVPFWLVALWAFGKGHPAWRARLLDHPVYGPPLRTWEEQGAIPRRAKRAAYVGLCGSVLICSLVLHDRPIVLAMVLVFLGGSGLFIASRPEPIVVRSAGPQPLPGAVPPGDGSDEP